MKVDIRNMCYIICYDISDNKRRNKLSGCLEGWGGRVQESVFEAVLELDLLDQLVKDIQKWINAQSDGVRIYPLCGTCAGKVLRLGVSGPVPGEEKVYVV